MKNWTNVKPWLNLAIANFQNSVFIIRKSLPPINFDTQN